MRKQICGELVAIARSIRPRIVVNRARNAYEAQIAANILSKFARQNLMIEPESLGFLYFDKCVPEAINSGTPFVVSYPKQKITACVADIANRLGFF
jgi:MinD-like ATPase involved in chromosome partitioning or flagellar assembly